MAREIINGQIEHGTRHVMEDEMREAGAGVFEKNAGAAPRNKARSAAPTNKALAEPSDSMTKAELLDMASREGVAVETDDNKADLIRKISKARK